MYTLRYSCLYIHTINSIHKIWGAYRTWISRGFFCKYVVHTALCIIGINVHILPNFIFSNKFVYYEALPIHTTVTFYIFGLHDALLLKRSNFVLFFFYFRWSVLMLDNIVKNEFSVTFSVRQNITTISAFIESVIIMCVISITRSYIKPAW